MPGPVILKKGCLMKKGQAWSIDLIIAAVIFILIIAIFYTILSKEPGSDVEQLKREGGFIATKLADGSAAPCSFIVDKEVDPQKLKDCFSGTPEQFKKDNNIRNKFCIFLVDQNGRLITVEDTGDKTYHRTGFGYPDLLVGNTSCGLNISDPNP